MKYISIFIIAAAWAVFYALLIHEIFLKPITPSLLESALINSLVAACTYVSGKALVFTQQFVSKVLWVVGLSATLSAGLVVIAQLINEQILTQLFELEVLSQNAVLMHSGFAFLMLLSAIGIRVQNLELSEQAAINERKEDAQRLAREAELLKLRHQLQPHFLFNSLNSVNALIGAKPDSARAMVHNLSDFLRGTLRSDDEKMVSLERELEHVRLYLDIEKVRFGHRLVTKIVVKDKDLSLSIPPLLLQPIIENSIKFGLYGTTDSVEIRLHGYLNRRMLVVEVTNPIDSDHQSQKGTGFGLSSVARRLHLIFGRNDLLETKIQDKIFITILKIPQQ